MGITFKPATLNTEILPINIIDKVNQAPYCVYLFGGFERLRTYGLNPLQ